MSLAPILLTNGNTALKQSGMEPGNSRSVSRGGLMNCKKCGGMMFSERVSDFSLTFYAWKCVNCGAMVDQTILANQYKRKRSPFKQRMTPAVTGKNKS